MGCHPGEDVHYIQWCLGYSFAPSAWGKGYATEAIGSIIRWAFTTWPELNRFQAVVYSFNKASAGLLRKLGFTLEGVRARRKTAK
jgi:ribosomal-protein-alanine N-acetyltransferase